MNFDIKLYAHGVPKGQSTWGVGHFDGIYIDAFYGRKSHAPVQMFVEVRQFGTHTNCYYTYLRTGNVCDSSGRSGSYIALTLRINYYYADIQNIYNLLDAAYNKFVVGSVVSQNGDVTKYLVSDFTQSDSILKALEQELNKYLMQFSTDSDFVPLNGFKVNGQSEPVLYNSLECDTKILINHVKSYSSISVSPFHPSTKEQQAVQKMASEVNAVKEKARQEIDVVKKQAEQKIAAAVRDKEETVKAIRDEYNNANAVISNLRKDVDKAQKEVLRLNSIVKEQNAKLQNVSSCEDKYTVALKELKEKDALIEKIRDSVSCFSGISDIKSQTYGNADYVDHPANKEEGFMGTIRKLHPLVDFLVMIVLLGLIAFTLPQRCSVPKDVQTEADSSKNSDDAFVKSDVLSDDVLGNADDLPNLVNDAHPSLKDKYPDATIRVAGLNSKHPDMIYGDGKTYYTVSLQNVHEILNGKWVSKDFKINGDTIRPKKLGACTILYVVDGDTLVKKTIRVKRK